MALVTINPGDTLGRIAARHGTTVREIMALNPQIRDPDRIFAGDRIRITGTVPISPVGTPAVIPQTQPTTHHTIRAGETLSGIAARHGTTVREIMALNPQIRDPDRIFAGSTIQISGVRAPTPAPQPIQPVIPISPQPRIEHPRYNIEQKPIKEHPEGRTVVTGIVPGVITGIIPETPEARAQREAQPPGVMLPQREAVTLTPPGTIEGIVALPGQIFQGIQGFIGGIENFLVNMGWSPRMAKIGMWALFLLALGKVFNLRIKV